MNKISIGKIYSVITRGFRVWLLGDCFGTFRKLKLDFSQNGLLT